MYKTTFLFLFLFLGTLNQIIAQKSNNLITGKVIDSKTKQPIENAELFISGTTIGTTTNQEGEFSLKAVITPCHLVVMHVSYESVVLATKPVKQITIELPHLSHKINEISIKGKNMRRRNLRLFYKYFMWNTTNQQVKVLNDSVLKFKRDKNDFHAYCTTPLLVENKYLAYDIKILIQDFHVCNKLLSTGKKVKLNAASSTGVFKLIGYHYYREAKIKNQQKRKLILSNRRSHYYGSLRHFLTSLYHNSITQNGYSITSKGKVKYPFILTRNSANMKQFKFGCDMVQVKYYSNSNNEPINLQSKFTASTSKSDTTNFLQIDNSQVDLKFSQYSYQNTTFLSLGKEFEVRPNGTSPNLIFEMKGVMSQSSPANTLPDNYSPK